MIAQLKKSLKKASADIVELSYSENQGTSIVLSKGEVERCLNFQGSSGSVRTFHQGGVGFCAFNDGSFEQGIQKSLE
ncbi:MAG: PmbA/TldA family metallopeptidase, partial [Brevinema sp.]